VSARLDVTLDPGPLERVRCELAVIFFFESDRPLRGGAGRADWRLCGQLSELLRAERIRGAVGEAVLIPTAGGLAAPRLLGLGLGARNRFDGDGCFALGREALARGLGLRVASIALQLPDPAAGDLDMRERLEALVNGAAAGLAGSDAAMCLNLVPGAAELPAARSSLPEISVRAPAGVAVQLFRAAAVKRTPVPLGAAGFSPGGAQTIK
jgi:hypothetical protein